jgi:hypothetical protein
MLDVSFIQDCNPFSEPGGQVLYILRTGLRNIASASTYVAFSRKSSLSGHYGATDRSNSDGRKMPVAMTLLLLSRDLIAYAHHNNPKGI